MPKPICIIPARGGSKGLPQKNILPLAGKPLIVHTIEQAQQTGLDVIVSTDDKEIAQVAHSVGARIIRRPKELSGDIAPSEWALMHVLNNIPPQEFVVFLQCTSPIRRRYDIRHAINTFFAERADSLLSVVPFKRFIWRGRDLRPYPSNYEPKSRPMRQNINEEEWMENGSIYILKPEVLERYGNRLGGKIALYPMPWYSAFEIDTAEDFALNEWILGQEFSNKGV